MIEALKELRQIIKMRDQKAFLPTKIREEALEDWIRRWVVETSYSQSILNPKALTSEMEDMLKEHNYFHHVEIHYPHKAKSLTY